MTEIDIKMATITNGTIEDMTIMIGKSRQIIIINKYIINNRDKTNHIITIKTIIDRIKKIITNRIMDQTTTKDKI